MNIRRFIDKNRKKIWNIILIIIFAIFIIKSLNYYYERQEERKRTEIAENVTNNTSNKKENITEKDYTIESNSIEVTMSSFLNYCNKREVENAYKMLTEECKKAMFPTVEDFERLYVNNVYRVEREYELTKWATDGNKDIYLVTLRGNMLATGNANNFTQEYYTFVKDSNGNYKLNINNYIYGEDRNLKTESRNITVEIGHVDIYNEYEIAKITITNGTENNICLTGNKYKKNIYLKSLTGVTYSSMNSKFDDEEIVMKPNSIQTFTVRFNKSYSSKMKATELILSDVILDYEDYQKCEDKTNYSNRTSIEVKYQES